MSNPKLTPLPFSLQPAIKRAKLAIQALLLDPKNPQKRVIALREIENADNVSSVAGRRRWRFEYLIVPHYGLFSTSWYGESHIKSTELVWDIDRMPEWAKNGRTEPAIGEIVNGKEYTQPPKSAER
jgi:hypothetical protein